VLPRGATLDQDAIDVDRATSILAALRATADLVVVSTGPLHLSAGALAWAQAADSAIVVAARDQARRDDVEYAAESLRLVGVEKAGTVLAERKRGIRRGRPTAGPVEPSRPVVHEPIRDTYPEPRPTPVPEPYREPRPVPVPEPYREPRPVPVPEPYREPRPTPVPEPYYEARPTPVPEPYDEPRPAPAAEPYRIVRDDLDEPLELDQSPQPKPLELDQSPQPKPLELDQRPQPKPPTRRTPRRRSQPNQPSA
jgi:hypothetical protein